MPPIQPDARILSVGGLKLPKGVFELKLFNNLYTQTSWFNGDGQRENLLVRSTYFTALTSFVYGVSRKVNLGLDVNFRSVRNDFTNTSPFRVFQFENSNLSRTAISTLGPKIRFNPLTNSTALTIQSSLWIPIAQNMQTPVFLEWDRYQLWVSLFYNRQSRDGKWLWFAASEVVPRVHRQDFFQEWDIIVYNKFIASYFLNRNWIFYATGEVTPTIGIKDAGGNQYFWYYGNFGLGAKYVWNNMLTFDLSHTRFLFGLTQGAGNTINLGIGLIK